MADVKFADETVINAAELATPDMANFAGNVHGGRIVLMADNLAFVCASRYAGATCVNAAMDRIDFYEPVHVGELLHLSARVAYTGHTSMEIDVDVHAEEITTGVMRRTNTCHLTFVALKDGKATPVPRLVPRTREDKARYLRAKTRREIGTRYREEREGVAGRYDDLDDAALDAMIAGADGAPAAPQ